MSEKKTMSEVMDGMPTSVSLSWGRADMPPDAGPHDPPLRVIAAVQFSEKGFGFGEVTLVQTSEGLFLDTEHMSLDRVKRYFNMLLDSAVLDTDMDPDRHALYNKVAGRRCNDRRRACAARPQDPPLEDP